MKKYLKGLLFSLFALGVMVLPQVSKAADFDATSTTGMLTAALAQVTPTLAYGIPVVIGIGLGIWVIFFLVGKLRRHTK